MRAARLRHNGRLRTTSTSRDFNGKRTPRRTNMLKVWSVLAAHTPAWFRGVNYMYGNADIDAQTKCSEAVYAQKLPKLNNSDMI